MVMRRNEGRERFFRAGMRELALHRPDLAMRHLRAATDGCSAAMPADLSRYLYWLAIALLRLDRPELALKSLSSAQKLRPRGRARDAYIARSNQYGMLRRSSGELDDFYAFFSAQAGVYLGRKANGRFDSNAEKDIVTKLIGGSWKELCRSGRLDGLKAAEKLRTFTAWRTGFPFLPIVADRNCKIFQADFRRGGQMRGDDRCSCGSGLPFMRCCGRSIVISDNK
jgi:hypothetical protein